MLTAQSEAMRAKSSVNTADFMSCQEMLHMYAYGFDWTQSNPNCRAVKHKEQSRETGDVC